MTEAQRVPATLNSSLPSLSEVKAQLLRLAFYANGHLSAVEDICRQAEQWVPNTWASVMRLNNEKHLHFFAAPSLPREAILALDGLHPGPETGSCGNAAFYGKPIFVAHIPTDARWNQLRPVTNDFRLKSGWSIPLREEENSNGRIIGTFSMISYVSRAPTLEQTQLLETIAAVISKILVRYSEEMDTRFKTAVINAISEGVFISDAQKQIVYVNQAFTQITGYSFPEIYYNKCGFLQGPGTSQQIWDGVCLALQKENSFKGEILNYRKDGRPYWTEMTIDPIRDYRGNITNYIGIQRDITERYELLERLRVAAKALDAQEAIIITDSQQRILEVNKAFTKVTGYTAHDVLGKTPVVLKSGRQSPAFYQEMWREIEKNGSWQGELWNRRKNGDIYPEWLSISAVTNDGGLVTHYIAHFMDISRRKAQEARLEHLATHDALTNLSNRYALDEELNRAMACADRNANRLAVCMLDLDNFKPINDTFGHDAGDQVLQVLAKRLRDNLRKTDFLARLGGDEFVLLVEDWKHLHTLKTVIDKIGKVVRAPITLENGKTVNLGLSMGVCIYPFEEGDNRDDLLRLADQALYEAKAHKTDRTRFWALYGQSVPRQLNRYQQLLRYGGLTVFYQPVLDSRSRQIVGMEALARLNDPDKGILSPAEFLPHLHDADLFDLMKKVFSQSLVDMQRIDAEGLQDLQLWISINLPPSSLNDACLAYLRDALAENPIDSRRITFEILEGGDFLNTVDAVHLLEELRTLGVRIALDDVGSAYSSLLRLKTLPVDEIKLDQGFVRTLERHPEDMHFITTFKDLADNFAVDLVVEGVETEDILDALTVLDAGILQGYGIAKPMPLEALMAFLKQPPSKHRQHPTSLLGLYAAQVAHHNAMKQALRQKLSLVSSMALLNTSICSLTQHFHRFGFTEGSTLDHLHREYHRVIAAMNSHLIASSQENDWGKVEEAHKALLAAILGERGYSS